MYKRAGKIKCVLNYLFTDEKQKCCFKASHKAKRKHFHFITPHAERLISARLPFAHWNVINAIKNISQKTSTSAIKKFKLPFSYRWRLCKRMSLHSRCSIAYYICLPALQSPSRLVFYIIITSSKGSKKKET